MIGGMAGLAPGFLYLDEVASGGPKSLTVEAWLVLLTMLCATPAAVLWCVNDLRRRLKKLR